MFILFMVMFYVYINIIIKNTTLIKYQSIRFRYYIDLFI